MPAHVDRERAAVLKQLAQHAPTALHAGLHARERDARGEERENQKGLYEHHAEEHGGEDLLAGAGVTTDTVEGSGNDLALAESATKSGSAYGEAKRAAAKAFKAEGVSEVVVCS